MKKLLIVALLCLNVALLAALVAVNLRPAQAQTIRGANDYLMVTAKVEPTVDGVYILDLRTRALAAWRFDFTAKRLVPFKGKALETDFK
jgi:hypothetical protein